MERHMAKAIDEIREEAQGRSELLLNVEMSVRKYLDSKLQPHKDRQARLIAIGMLFEELSSIVEWWSGGYSPLHIDDSEKE